MIGTLFVFIFKSGMVLLALLLVYKLLLSGDRQPAFSRGMLLSFYVLAPLAVYLSDFNTIDVNLMETGLTDKEMLALLLSRAEQGAPKAEAIAPLWPRIVLAVWIVGMAVITVMTIVCQLRVRKLISKSDKIIYRGTKVALCDDDSIGPFSVRSTIVMSRKDFEDSGEVIILHELRHIGAQHWIDLCLSRLAIIVCWFNPATWLMADELRTVHEYQADSAVLSAGVDATQYQMLLIKKAVGRSFPAIANSLNHSNLKKRITMMLKSKQSKGRRWRALVLAPAAAAVLMAGNIPAVSNAMAAVATATIPTFSESKVNEISEPGKVESQNKPVHVSTTTTYNIKGQNVGVRNTSDISVDQNGKVININDNPTYTVNGQEVSAEEFAKLDVNKVTDVEVSSGSERPQINVKLDSDGKDNSTEVVLPQFPGGEQAMYSWLIENIKFPDTEAAKKIDKKQRVVVRFAISETGKVHSPEIVKSASLPEFDKEAMRIVNELPDFVPGTQNGKAVATTYTLPIVFAAK